MPGGYVSFNLISPTLEQAQTLFNDFINLDGKPRDDAFLALYGLRGFLLSNQQHFVAYFREILTTDNRARIYTATALCFYTSSKISIVDYLAKQNEFLDDYAIIIAAMRRGFNGTQAVDIKVGNERCDAALEWLKAKKLTKDVRGLLDIIRDVGIRYCSIYNKENHKAYWLFEKLAKTEYFFGVANLGLCYFYGNGTQKNHSEANKLFLKSFLIAEGGEVGTILKWIKDFHGTPFRFSVSPVAQINFLRKCAKVITDALAEDFFSRSDLGDLKSAFFPRVFDDIESQASGNPEVFYWITMIRYQLVSWHDLDEVKPQRRIDRNNLPAFLSLLVKDNILSTDYKNEFLSKVRSLLNLSQADLDKMIREIKQPTAPPKPMPVVSSVVTISVQAKSSASSSLSFHGPKPAAATNPVRKEELKRGGPKKSVRFAPEEAIAPICRP